MKVQQAPLPVQAALLLPEIVASTTIQFRDGGRTIQSSTSTSTVSGVFEPERNSWRRSQSNTGGDPLPVPPIRPWTRPFGAAAALVGVSAVTKESLRPAAAAGGRAQDGQGTGAAWSSF